MTNDFPAAIHNADSSNGGGTDSPARTADAKRGRTAGQRRARGFWLFIRDIIVIFLAALLISFLIKTFLIRSFYIPSESMRETLHVNDRIIVNLLEPAYFPIQNGDVVVFRDPGGWLTQQTTTPVDQPPLVAAVDKFLGFVGLSAPDSEDHLIKRVIGMPGDVVVCCNALGQLTVNGIPLSEPYTTLPAGVTKATKDDFSVTVPDGFLWMMGDNRYNSADSAFHHTNSPGREFVPLTNVVGRAMVISWPLDRWSVLDDYPLVFNGVADAQQ
jgi:signal peptidase I